VETMLHGTFLFGHRFLPVLVYKFVFLVLNGMQGNPTIVPGQL